MKPVLLDVDTGIDDALALSYAILSKKLNIIGITTCFGNVTVEEATRNTRYLLDKLGSTIPVYSGARESLVRGEREVYARHVHGEDGLGNLIGNFDQSLPDTKENAVDYIIKAVRQYPQQLTMISVGPLTNLALAIQKDPSIIPLFKEVVVMGGAVYRGGNVTQFAEANIHCDPEAAEVVFSSGIELTLVGLDVTMQTLLPMTEINKWKASSQLFHRLLGEMTEHYISFYESFNPGIGGCALHDPLAVGVALNKAFVETRKERIEVALDGEQVGRTRRGAKNRPYVNVCEKVDASGFLNHFLNTITNEL